MELRIIAAMQERFRAFTEKRFLRRHGCESWEEYNRAYDPLLASIYPYTSIRKWYKGYGYLICYDSPWYQFGDWLQGLEKIDSWCKERCIGKWRKDILRVIEHQWDKDDWEINEIAGYDTLFFVFEKEEDYVWFKLRWS